MKPISSGLAAFVAAALLAAAPAFAKDHGQGNGHGKGQDKQEEKAQKHADKERDKAEKRADKRGEDIRQGAYFNDRQREYAHRYYEERYGRVGRCPPGLAKKGNGCMPPGQARKWAVGEPIPRGVTVYSVPQPVLVQLPPPPYGYHYARIGPDIVLVRNQNNIVIDIMLNVFG